MRKYQIVEFENWYDIAKMLNEAQPSRWTLVNMPNKGLTGHSGKIMLEFDEPERTERE